jgi:hypothetical protein
MIFTLPKVSTSIRQIWIFKLLADYWMHYLGSYESGEKLLARLSFLDLNNGWVK